MLYPCCIGEFFPCIYGSHHSRIGYVSDIITEGVLKYPYFLGVNLSKTRVRVSEINLGFWWRLKAFEFQVI
jgi:hypothetical protein